VLVDWLLASGGMPVVSVVAPPGYGKTTLLAQWAERADGRVAWVNVDRRDNDPAVLLTYIAAGLDRIEPIEPAALRALGSPGLSSVAAMVSRLASAVSVMTRPVVLVLDHAEVLENQQCLDAVAELAMHLPAGSQIAFASRSRPSLPTALLRARGQLKEVGPAELAMDELEARGLLEGAGVRLAREDTVELIRRTEGWPAGLYLAALAVKAGSPQRGAGFAFTGDDLFMADYLRSELLSRLSPEEVRFLTRTSVLDRMSGPLCDAVVGVPGSGPVLETLESRNLLVVPLDRHRKWYRYHHLFRELLRAELERGEPELVRRLHSRAAAWFEANGMPEMAIDHAQAAGDADRVADLVWNLAQPSYASGRADTALGWLQWFDNEGLIERYPSIAIQGAWLHALLGQPAAAERWTAAAERGSAGGMLPDGSTVEASVALLRALLCPAGIDRMRADAEAAFAGLSPASPWRATALSLQGISYLLEGETEQADPILAQTVTVATHAGALPAASAALAERSIVARERQDWHEAEALAEEALRIMRDGHLDDYVISPFIHAVVARTALRRGDIRRARKHLAQAARQRPLLTHAMPHRSVQTLLELVRAYLALDDAAGGRVVLRQAQEILQRRPDLGILPRQAAELRSKLDMIAGGTPGASSLTTAELRLLPLLSTHLTLGEIGERLHLSRHTVKTQTTSVYRKLGVSSRSEAIERGRETGLVDV